MKKQAYFLLLAVLFALLIIYNKHLFFYLEAQLVKDHIAKLAPVYKSNHLPEKISFCTSRSYSKVWAHRVNTLERFLFLSKHFQGFEIDIIFNSSRDFLDVRHPPDASFNLSFEKYLQAAESKGKFFWLDVKNLTEDNEKAVLTCLNQLDENYKIRNRIIIESNNILQLSKISEAGYFTSYYYDMDSYRDFISYGDEGARDSIFEKIDAVSQDVLIYDTLVKKFPSKPRLTWALSTKNYLFDSLFNSLDTDKGLLVYLVNIKSPNYR